MAEASVRKAALATDPALSRHASELSNALTEYQEGRQNIGALQPFNSVPNRADNVIPQWELMRGRWVPADTKGDQMIEDYLSAPKALGSKRLPMKEYTEWKQRKLERLSNLNLLRAGQLLIDPKNPETQVNAYNVLSELRDVTEADFRSNLQIQIYLRSIVMAGEVRTREELIFLIDMCSPKFKLPTDPLWDLNGVIGGARDGAAGAGRSNASLITDFMFSRVWGAAVDVDDAETVKKAKILQRCLPACRGMPLATVQAIVKEIGEGTTGTNRKPSILFTPGALPVPGTAADPKAGSFDFGA